MQRWISSCLVLVVVATAAATASAQSLGNLKWQLQPYCNVVTVTVTGVAGVYTLEGFDDQCGAPTRAPLTGVATPNPDGTIGFGLNIVTSPGGRGIHVEARISMATLSGPWTDSDGHKGTFALNGSTGGSPRPLPVSTPVIPPAFGLRTDGGFVAAGATGTGTIPATGVGTRMMWHPSKAAFRAGKAEGSEWDEPNVGLYSTAFGLLTTASGAASLAAGFRAVASGSSAIALGQDVVASGHGSVALGVGATSPRGSFTFADNSVFASITSGVNQFNVRAAGGAGIYSNSTLTAGVELRPGASAWSSVSDVNRKENFRVLDGAEVLAKLAAMSIREWNYKSQDAAIRHVGPTAQDFHAAFGLGEDPLRISTIDADGIALAGVSALARENTALKAQLAALSARLAALERDRN
jgi:hypothetical protein